MQDLTERLFAEIRKIPLVDPHSHIDPRKPTAADLDDLLGYHYYTELAHSAGMTKDALRSDVPAEERAEAIARYLPAIENTVQYSWLLEMARELFSFPHERIDASNVFELWKLSEKTLQREGWEDDLFHRAGLERVFLTSDFDDTLDGVDTERYVPCLRTDDLVFHLDNAGVVERLRQTAGTDVGNVSSLRKAVAAVFEAFVRRGARACAISLPPDFVPEKVEGAAVDAALREVLAGEAPGAGERAAVSRWVFWTLAELCAEHRLPFDLMIGVYRNVYPGGVHQGRDLFNRLTSLHQYRHLFNAFPSVVFPVSVLASDADQELAAYSWIFPNVFCCGHWWYSNVPPLIESSVRLRLAAVARTKQIGYYSDAYKLEFIVPKFNTYRRALARVLAEDFVKSRRWSEEKAVELAHDLLRRNVERVFFPEGAGNENDGSQMP